MARKAPKIALSQEEREYLQALVARHTAEQREVLRARIVLSADEEKENQEIAKELGITQDIVGKWRTRFFHRGKEGLEDKPRPGKPKKFDHEVRLKVIEVACSRPEKITHWSTRELAKKANEELTINISRLSKGFSLLLT